MKILFICGSLESGKDGVGDYTRRLAAEIIRQGNQSGIISINDKYVSAPLKELQYDCGTSVQTLRLPNNKDYSSKILPAMEFVRLIHPDWLSLQYVPFSFHSKGLPRKLLKFLKVINANSSWHLMFHETWVGISKISSIKHKFWGLLQKNVALELIDKLTPDFITTSNKLYQLVLQSNSVNVEILPLFSNIPFVNCDFSRRKQILDFIGLDDNLQENVFILIFFGSLYPEADFENGINKIIRTHCATKKLVVLGVGHISVKMLTYFNSLKIKYSENINMFHLGNQLPEDISEILQSCDMAFSCTPFPHIGKSGVFATYRRHGLPVWIESNEYLPEFSPIIIDYNNKLFEKSFDSWDVSTVAKDYLTFLKNK
jgi:glycosyltransferase involved in cell wall biosynthesis